MTDAKTIIEQLLRRRTPATFRAGGPSMNPTIRDGESVRIRPLRAGDPRPGAVALYRRHDRLVLHRLLRRDPATGAFLAAADAAAAGGEWIAEADLLGIAEWVRRAGRVRRLDSPLARRTGLLRHALRPLRRALLHFRAANHAHASAPRP